MSPTPPANGRWNLICAQLSSEGVVVSPEEEGSQQRAFYSTLSERAARKKAGGSVTLLLLQPTPSLRAAPTLARWHR